MNPTQKALFSIAIATASIAFVPTRFTMTAGADAPVAPAPTAIGLDALGDDAVLNELANRGLDDLLTRAFDQNKIPQDKRDSIKTVSTLKRLMNDPSLTPLQKQQMTDKVVADIDRLLPNLADNPLQIVSLAQTITTQAVDPEIAVIEYWGETDTEKAKLKPMAETASRLYDMANKVAAKKADEIGNKINRPDDPLADQWQKMNDLAAAALYQKTRIAYALALSMDKANPDRAKICDDALTAMQQWDTPDSGIQPAVRLLMAKLYVTKGGDDDFVKAKALLANLADPKTDVQPAPTPAQVFEAHCYAVIASLAAGKPADAQTALTDAKTDQEAHFKDDMADAAALRLLSYRILALQADQAPAGAAKDAANADTVAALGQLVRDFPGLRKVIFAQLISRMPAAPDFTKIDPVVLQALMADGRQDLVTKKPTDPQDKPKLQRALGAAKEILSRGAAGKMEPAAIADASLLQGLLQQYLGDKLAAVDALLDHVEKYAADPKSTASFALDQATNILIDLRSSSPVDPHGRPDPEIERLQDRFYPIAINPPFNRKTFALDYAARLFGQEKWAEAVKFYKLVPNNETPPRMLASKYGEMVALKNELDDATSKLTPEDRGAIVSEIQQLADAVNKIASDLLKASTSETEKTRARSTLARTSLLAADITRREQKNPQRVLDLLKGFEDSVQGLPDSKNLLSGALFLRVQSYMQLGRQNEATQSLVDYLNATGGNEGAETVHELLTTLNKDLDKARTEAESARAANDEAATKTADALVLQIADNRAVLSGFLVDWASKSNDPKIHNFTYIYRRFAADTKRLAATLEPDPDARKRKLGAALEEYNTLLQPENVVLYQATIDPNSKIDKDYPDPSVTLGIGLIDYELGDCKGVSDKLGQLVRDEKLGENNDQYWEATYKLLDCMHTLAKSGDASVTDAQVQQSLKILYLVWRDGTGGKKWHDKFEALRISVMPDWKVPASTQPVS